MHFLMLSVLFVAEQNTVLQYIVSGVANSLLVTDDVTQFSQLFQNLYLYFLEQWIYVQHAFVSFCVS